MNNTIITCYVEEHLDCGEDECALSSLSNMRGTIEIESINQLIHSEFEYEFLFKPSDSNEIEPVWIRKGYLFFKSPIYSE